MKQKITIISAASLAFIFSACTPLFPPQPGSEIQTFVLADIEAEKSAKTIPATLVIEEFEVNAGLDTDKIARTQNNQISYYEKARWADNLEDVARSTMIESFENSGNFKSVIQEVQGVLGDYSLSNRIWDFQIKTEGVEIPEARVKIVTRIYSLPQRKVLLSFTSESKTPLDSENMDDVIESLNKSFHVVQKDIIGKVTEFLAGMTAPAK